MNEGDGKARRPGIVYGSIRETGERRRVAQNTHGHTPAMAEEKRRTPERTGGEPRAEGREKGGS